MPTSLECIAIVRNRKGIHARPSAKIVDAAKEFESEILISSEDFTANAKRLLDVLSLAAVKGTRLKVQVTGEDAQEALEAIRVLLESEFALD